MEFEKPIAESYAADGQNYHYPPGNNNSLPSSGHVVSKGTGNQKHFTDGFLTSPLPFLPLIGLKNAKTNGQKCYLFMGASLGAVILSLLFCGAWRIIFSFDKVCQNASSNNNEYRFTGCLTEDAIMITCFTFGFLGFLYGVASIVFYVGRKG